MNRQHLFKFLAGVMSSLVSLSLLASPVLAAAGDSTRVSIDSSGTQGSGDSLYPSISADGRYVAFHSDASNLVSGDSNAIFDVFVRDRQTSQTRRVSVASDGTQGNGSSLSPSISADGRYVAFHSYASNLVSGDTNGYYDIFEYDLQTGETKRVSVATGGAQASGNSYSAAISSDGRYVVFQSDASNLVSGDTNNTTDIFVRDMQSGQTWRVSVATGGTQGNNASESPSISSDGRYIAFRSFANNLISGDTNGMRDIFVNDRQAATTKRVSVATNGTQANQDSWLPSISADGRYVAFHSAANNLVSGDTNAVLDVFIRDLQTGETRRVSVATAGTQGNGNSYSASLSNDGRYVAFQSEANNLASGDTNGTLDVFVYSTLNGQTVRASVASGGTQGNDGSWDPSISADGSFVAFHSVASNLVSGDTNSKFDVFVNELAIPRFPVPISPAGTINGPAAPAFVWSIFPGATSYKLAVYSQAAASYLIQDSVPTSYCTSTQCSYPSPVTFSNGDFKFKVLASTPTGTTPYSNWMMFTVTGADLPMPISPNGTVNTHRPAFKWSTSSTATFYRLGVYSNATASYLILENVYPTCASGVCTYTSPSVDLPNGDYKFKVMGKNSTGNTPYSNWMSFTVSSKLPLAPTPLAPSGTISANPPEFQWSVVSGATKYRLAVYSYVTANYLILTDVNPSACSGSLCIYLPSAALASGKYKFKLLTYNAYGASGYSPFMSFIVP